jgi:hypothetical protein
VTLRPGRQPLEALVAALVRVGSQTNVEAAADSPDQAPLLAQLRIEPGFLGTQLRGHARRTGVNILVFVDQLEELFTLVPDPRERLAFKAALAGVADDPSAPLSVVVSMRSDFLDHTAEDARFADELSRGLMVLSTPDRNALREAIEHRLAMVGHRFESAAIVGDMLDALAGTPGALALLQFSAAKLWEGRDRTRKIITPTTSTSECTMHGPRARVVTRRRTRAWRAAIRSAGDTFRFVELASGAFAVAVR